MSSALAAPSTGAAASLTSRASSRVPATPLRGARNHADCQLAGHRDQANLRAPVNSVQPCRRCPGGAAAGGRRGRPAAGGAEQHLVVAGTGVLLADEGQRGLQRPDQRFDVVLDFAALQAQPFDFALDVLEPRLRLLQDQVGAGLGFAVIRLGLGLRVLLDLVGHLLRGEQRVAQVALLAAMLAEHGFELGDLLAQPVVLAQRVLVIVGDLEQERLTSPRS